MRERIRESERLMRDELLFVVAPRVAALCCLTIVGVLLFAGRGPAQPAVEDRDSGDPLLTYWRFPVLLVLVRHLLLRRLPRKGRRAVLGPVRYLLLQPAALL